MLFGKRDSGAVLAHQRFRQGSGRRHQFREVHIGTAVSDGAQHASPVGIRAEHGCFGREEQITLLATVLAISWVAAPVTLHSGSLVAPSPSPAMRRAEVNGHRVERPHEGIKVRPGAVISALPAIPFARSVTISLVEVSPSTLTMLNVSDTSPESACCSIFALIAQSVVRKDQHGCHIGVDHSGAFCNPAEVAGRAADPKIPRRSLCAWYPWS